MIRQVTFGFLISMMSSCSLFLNCSPVAINDMTYHLDNLLDIYLNTLWFIVDDNSTKYLNTVCSDTVKNFSHAYSKHFTRLGFKTCLSNTKTKTKTCLSKTKTKTQQFQDQDQDQDSAVSRPRPRLAYPRPRPRLRCPRPRLKTYKTNTGSPWLGWTVTNKKSWQAENPAYQ